MARFFDKDAQDMHLMHGLSESVGDTDAKIVTGKCYQHDQAKLQDIKQSFGG